MLIHQLYSLSSHIIRLGINTTLGICFCKHSCAVRVREGAAVGCAAEREFWCRYGKQSGWRPAEPRLSMWLLWRLLLGGRRTLVGSPHTPHPPRPKRPLNPQTGGIRAGLGLYIVVEDAAEKWLEGANEAGAEGGKYHEDLVDSIRFLKISILHELVPLPEILPFFQFAEPPFGNKYGPLVALLVVSIHSLADCPAYGEG